MIYILVIAGLAVVSVILLASALRSSDLLPGGSLPFWLDWNFRPIPPIDIPGGSFLLQLIRFLYLTAFIFLPLALIYLLLSKQARKYFFNFILRMIPIFILINLIIRWISSLKQEKTETGAEMGMMPTPENVTVGQIPEFSPQVSERLVTFLTVGISILIVLILFGVGWWLWRRSQRRRASMEQFAEHAQTALNDLQAGGNFRNVIIRCYMDMTRAAEQLRGIRRASAMTPHEFSAFLQADGLPKGPVEQLTGLFENVRYGAEDPTPLQERIAIDSLQSIVEFCRGMR